MAYRLKVGEKTAAGMARIITEQVQRFGTQSGDAGARTEWVHETRKGLKRLRALLRLLQTPTASGELAVSRVALRELGRQLSAERIRAVLPLTLDAVATEAGIERSPAVAAARRRIEQERHKLIATASPSRGDDAHITARLRKLLECSQELTNDCTLETIMRAAGKTYARGRRQLEVAYDDPGPQCFHELRKLVQLHWRHCQILSRAWPEEMGIRIETARRLSTILGQENDLSEACDWLQARRGAGLSAQHADTLLAWAMRLRTQRRDEARPLAARLYAEKRGAFQNRLSAYWTAAGLDRELTKAQAARAATRSGRSRREKQSRAPA